MTCRGLRLRGNHLLHHLNHLSCTSWLYYLHQLLRCVRRRRVLQPHYLLLLLLLYDGGVGNPNHLLTTLLDPLTNDHGLEGCGRSASGLLNHCWCRLRCHLAAWHHTLLYHKLLLLAPW